MNKKIIILLTTFLSLLTKTIAYTGDYSRAETRRTLVDIIWKFGVILIKDYWMVLGFILIFFWIEVKFRLVRERIGKREN